MPSCGSGRAREASTAMDATGFAGVRGRARSHKGPALASHQHANGFQAQGGFIQHRQAIFALLAQGVDFAVTYARVDRLQRYQARQLLVSLGCQAALGFGHALNVGWQNLLFAATDTLGQHIALGLDELVGAGARYALELVVQGFEGHA